MNPTNQTDLYYKNQLLKTKEILTTYIGDLEKTHILKSTFQETIGLPEGNIYWTEKEIDGNCKKEITTGTF